MSPPTKPVRFISVDIDNRVAIRAQQDGGVLTLQVEDGRCIDFFVTRVTPGEASIDVEATDGLTVRPA